MSETRLLLIADRATGNDVTNSMLKLEQVDVDLKYSGEIFASADDDDLGGGHNTGVVEQIAKPALKKPNMYKVILVNDDYTPMEFVIEILQVFFSLNREKATQIMMAVHTAGKATCGIFTMDIAETKSAQVNQYAQECQHPLISIIEAAD